MSMTQMIVNATKARLHRLLGDRSRERTAPRPAAREEEDGAWLDHWLADRESRWLRG
jgi:hypothetical protein